MVPRLAPNNEPPTEAQKGSLVVVPSVIKLNPAMTMPSKNPVVADHWVIDASDSLILML
jgi:hypothetical protein